MFFKTLSAKVPRDTASEILAVSIHEGITQQNLLVKLSKLFVSLMQYKANGETLDEFIEWVKAACAAQARDEGE